MATIIERLRHDLALWRQRFLGGIAQPGADVADEADVVGMPDGIHLRDVHLRRGDQTILDGLSLDLTESRIAFVGRNGSGKSTLAKIIKGLMRPDDGMVRVYGRNPARRTRTDLGAIGFLFQNSDHQILCPTVLEEICFGLVENKMPRDQSEAAGMALMSSYGIAGWRDRAVATLSEGQRRLVCLLAVLIMQPRTIILDEPFNGLDIPTQLQLTKVIAKLPQQIIMISHDPNRIGDCDRIIWLDEGRVIADAPPGDLLPAFLTKMHATVTGATTWEA